MSALLVTLPFISAVDGGRAAQQYSPPHQLTGPAVDTIRFRAFHVDTAPAEIRAGQMDIYYFGLKVAAARELIGTEGIKIYEAPTSTLSLLLNPAPAIEGELNPFAIKEVRQAVNLIINRDFIANDIYMGMAVPMISHVSPFDYDFLTLYDLIRGSAIEYDPDFALSMVENGMTQAGAVRDDQGMWTFDGNQIRLKFIIRVEDERREVGDLIRAELGSLGFMVDPVYQQFGPAIFRVYATDPQQFEWHLYTEGWGRSVPERFDSGSLNQFCAPWLGSMPGWQELGFWQYENPTLDDLGQKVFRGDFVSQDERDSIYLDATTICLNESVRLWIANVVNSLPAKSGITGVTEDIISGPKSLWTQRDAFIPGQSELTIGNLWVWTERTTWNPVGGFGDVYSVDIWRNMYDPPVTRHPFTGLPIPYRVNFGVETAGPTGRLDVPSDAFIWNSGTSSWESVGSGIRATSKVTFDYSKYFSSNWHHGEPINMADVIYSIHQNFDITFNEDKSRVEFAIATVAEPYLDTFKGFRIISDTELEVYVDFWHFAPEYIADFASVSGLTMPWEILYAMDTLVFDQRKAAYSDTSAQRYSLPWISLVQDRDARLVRSVLRELEASETFPTDALSVGGQQLVGSRDAVDRYGASLSWFDEFGMLVISNGPFTLTTYDPPAQFAELKAFRDPSYPFRPGEFFMGKADLIEIVSVDREMVQIGAENEFMVELSGEGELGLRYVIVDPSSGEIIATGEASRTSGDQFIISIGPEISSKMRAGLYKLYMAAFSDQLSSISEKVQIIEATTESVSPIVPPSPEKVNESSPKDDGEKLVGDVVQSKEPDIIREPQETPATSIPIGTILPIVVGVVILAVGAVFILRRK